MDSRTRTAVATVGGAMPRRIVEPSLARRRARCPESVVLRVAAVGPGIGTSHAAATASPRVQSARRDRRAVLTDRSAAAAAGACTARVHHQATHVVASRCDARPAVSRTRTGGAAADRLTVGLPGRVRRRVGPARRDSATSPSQESRPAGSNGRRGRCSGGVTGDGAPPSYVVRRR